MTRFDTLVKPNRPRSLANRTIRTERDVREMLREIAYVLHCTRKIKAEILAEREMRSGRIESAEANAI